MNYKNKKRRRETMAKYKRVIVEKQDGTLIPAEEPVFVLRAQDILAPLAVEYYAELVDRAIGGGIGASIRNISADMRNWKTRKWPD